MNIDVLDEDGASNIMHPELFGKPNKSEILAYSENLKKQLASTMAVPAQLINQLISNDLSKNHLFVGAKVDVDFISESRTEFSGNHFKGRGVIDRIEDGRIFGRLNNGNPFMCFPGDVLLVEGEKA